VAAIAVSWNTTNVGAVASQTAASYGVPLAAVGLFTTALFVTHLLGQVPGGRLVDRFGARHVCLLGMGLIVCGAACSMLAPAPVLGIAARALTGAGTGVGFIAGSAYVRRTGGSAFAQGLYGGIGLSAGGLAIAIVPEFVPMLSWRAPYATSLVLALLALAALLVAPEDGVVSPATHSRASLASLVSDADLRRLGVLYSVTFGLTLALSNWIVELLTRHGVSAEAGLVGGLILMVGVVARPFGGWILRTHKKWARPMVALSLVMGGLGTGLLATGGSLAAAIAGCLLLGFGGGISFASAFTGSATLRPDAPAAAGGFVNAMAAATVLVCTPLIGLTFSLPGDGRIGFAVAVLAWLVALVVLPDRRGLGA